MTEFNPEVEPETQEQYDAYVRWCGEQIERVVSDDETPRSYRTAFRVAAWLAVVSQAQIHLHDDVEQSRDVLLRNLMGGCKLARDVERQRSLELRDLVVARSVLDCWAPVGRYALNLLDAAKHALSALVLMEVHPLIDLWDLDAPDAWALILIGVERLREIAEGGGPLDYDDYAVIPNGTTIDKMNWQKVNNLAAQLGAPPMSAN